MTLFDRMKAKWEAAGRGALDERAPLLANWYLGNRHAWWEAMEMVEAAEPTRPAVTREAVTRVVTGPPHTDCFANAGDCCAPDKCPCAQTIDAIMTLIGDAP